MTVYPRFYPVMTPPFGKAKSGDREIDDVMRGGLLDCTCITGNGITMTS